MKATAMEFTYPYELQPDGDDFLIIVPNFPEILSNVRADEVESGAARNVALDAVKHAMQARIDFSDEIPAPPKNVGKCDPLTLIAVPPLTSLKIMLYLELKRSGKTKSAFAKEIGITPTDAARLLDLFHDSRSDQIMQAFGGLNMIVRTKLEVSAQRA
jgi:hypothetical protein